MVIKIFTKKIQWGEEIFKAGHSPLLSIHFSSHSCSCCFLFTFRTSWHSILFDFLILSYSKQGYLAQNEGRDKPGSTEPHATSALSRTSCNFSIEQSSLIVGRVNGSYCYQWVNMDLSEYNALSPPLSPYLVGGERGRLCTLTCPQLRDKRSL